MFCWKERLIETPFDVPWLRDILKGVDGRFVMSQMSFASIVADEKVTCHTFENRKRTLTEGKRSSVTFAARLLQPSFLRFSQNFR